MQHVGAYVTWDTNCNDSRTNSTEWSVIRTIKIPNNRRKKVTLERKKKITHVSAECGQPWCCGKTEKKTKRKNSRWFTSIKYTYADVCTHTHKCVAHIAPKSCRRQSCAQNGRRGRREKKYAKEQKTREVTVHTKRNRRARRRERRKNYLHQDSAQFSSYHATNDKRLRHVFFLSHREACLRCEPSMTKDSEPELDSRVDE
ncbi:hypothetical protein EAG_12302 [Camponotus floridanus]|uniref:Uncharacterized protein n=1 Tax=Camponotus floridanus TaxID=104421 RepID=E2AWM5_CAMFO|nr:hypothetical protein EAG_12302 [Camponotus floridanus]